MIDQPGPRPPETRDRNLSRVIARIRDDGPALVDGDEALGLWSQGPVVPVGLEALRAAPLARDAAHAASPGDQPGSRPSAPSASAPQVPLARPADAGPAPPTASTRRLGWLLPGALVAASVVALGVVGVLYLAPPQGSARGTPNAGEPALRSQLAVLQGTITALSERIESLTTEDESRQVDALGERLDRMSRQVADLAQDDRLPGDLDRRLEALAQGLDSMASRMERLSNLGERPQGTGLADGGGAAEVALPPPPLAGVRGQGSPEIGAADLQAEPVPSGLGAMGQGMEPRGTSDGRPAEVADGVRPPGPILAQARSLGDDPGSVGPEGGDSRPKHGSPEGEDSGPESLPPAESVPAEPLSAESLPAEEPFPVPLLSQDSTGGQPPSEGAPTRADLAKESSPPAADQAESPGLAASSEQGEPALAGVAATEGDAAGQPRLKPTGSGSGTRSVQPVRQRVATASASQSKGPVSKEDEPVRQPRLRVVDDLF